MMNPYKIQIIKPLALLLFFSLGLFEAQGQVKIGDNTEDISPFAILELERTNRGLLLPKMTTEQRDQAFDQTAPEGIMILNMDRQASLYESGETIMPVGIITPSSTIFTDIISVTPPSAGKYRLTTQVHSELDASTRITYGLAYTTTPPGAIVTNTISLAQWIGTGNSKGKEHLYG